MKQIDVYHDTRLVFGYEVHYRGIQDETYQVGHHIGGHLTGDARCDTFIFEQDEYMNDMVVSSGDVVDRIEFTTN